MNIIIIGSGFAGATFARLAADQGHRCIVYEERAHVGGNSWDHRIAGVSVHAYGPHYFRTDNPAVIEFLSRFTGWRRTIYRVVAAVRGRCVRFPLSAATYQDLYGRALSAAQWRGELAGRRIALDVVNNAEDWLLANVGREFYELFYEGYTTKQWGLHPRELNSRIVARIPVYQDHTWQYVKAKFQALPAAGYAALFENMLDHPRIEVKLASPWDGRRGDLTVYTGPLDAWFGYRFGTLPYRSLEFRTKVLAQKEFQPCGQVNFPGKDVPYTRCIEWKKVTGEESASTVITREYPRAQGRPYYPIPTPEADRLAQIYRSLAAQEKGVVFLGRLATYQYLNMDQAVLQAMQCAERVLAEADVRMPIQPLVLPAGGFGRPPALWTALLSVMRIIRLTDYPLPVRLRVP